ncbi:MAG: hypothetical protein KGY61_01005 [Desulfobacterales bacterium]|nr:hypothetical protein [Desulfobacterales bacterium]
MVPQVDRLFGGCLFNKKKETAWQARILKTKLDGFVKSGLFRRGGIFAESNSKKHPHCHFERQREILNNQDSSSLSLLGMTES